MLADIKLVVPSIFVAIFIIAVIICFWFALWALVIQPAILVFARWALDIKEEEFNDRD